jgi:starch phosphorylase
MFPGYSIRALTNGVHVPTWTHPALARLFQQLAPDWAHVPESLMDADQLPDDLVIAAHREAKDDLLAEVARRTGRKLQPEKLLLAFARRITGYKRPDLLFSDIERLRAIHQKHRVQIVMAGKSHPRDEGGKALLKDIHRHIKELAGEPDVVYMPGYDMTLAKLMVAGADIWLNTPLPPLEASGTSGMKAALNGVLNLSVLDGWWVEAWREGVTGWAVGRDGDKYDEHARALYSKLEDVILPLFYGDKERWVWMMKQSISKIGPRFNSQHMMRRYASEAYLR